MRKKRYPVSLILLLLCGMMVLTSCSAITAQQIPLNSTSTMGGGNNRNALRGMMNADLIGKIVAVNGSKITIDVMEQAQRRSTALYDHSAVLSSPSKTATPSSKRTPDTHKPDTDRTLPTDRSDDSTSTMSKTGVEKTITIGEEVSISQITAMMPQTNKNSTTTTLKVSDLKAGQILMIWYKDNTNTVEKVSVMDS